MLTQLNGPDTAYTPHSDKPSNGNGGKFIATVKLLAFVVTAASSCIMAGVFLASYRSLPDRMTRTETQLAETKAFFTGEFNALRAEISGMKEFQRQQVCLQIAERRHLEWQSCLIPKVP